MGEARREKKMKASDLFLRCLEAQGVKTIFGVPGEENADLMMSLLDSPVEFIICRHEQGAAFMADIYGRLTGKPGVALSTLGPGATNLATGIANATLDRSPVVAIVGQTSVKRLHKEAHQNMDSVAMFEPITKWSRSIYDPDSIPEVINKAFKLAVAEKPGASMIELPENIAKKETDVSPFPDGKRVRRPAPDPRAVAEGVKLLDKAKAPLILAGNGCIRARASKALNRLVDTTGIHVVTTFMGKGALSARHERCMFTGGLASRDHVTEAIDEADLVLCIGVDMIEWHPSVWNAGKDKKILHIDFQPAEVDEHYRVAVEIIGDLAGAMNALADAMGKEHTWDIDTFRFERQHMIDELAAYADDDGSPVKPQKILYDLRSLMADEDILISDVGAHKMWVARHYPTYLPGTCHISNGFCSMGIALPGAISGKMLFPKKRVVGLMGDGGFMMNIQELATTVQYKIPATFLIWDDGGYGLIEWKQQLTFGKTSHTRFSNPDFVHLAEAFGCKGIRVETSGELIPALQEAFENDSSPTVVIVAVDYRENIKLSERQGRLTCWLDHE